MTATQPKLYPYKTLCAFLLVLLLMPLGHALMILMEHFMDPEPLHYCAFAIGFAGMIIAIAGIYVKGDTRQTIFGLVGGLLFWTGWVEFLFAYFAARFGVHCDLLGSGVVQTTTHYSDGFAVAQEYLVNGLPIDTYSRPELKEIRGSRPEYLIMPATFGMWMMFIMLYLFCTRTGCRFFGWIQRHLHLQARVELRPLTHLPSMVTFMELNLMLWSLYLLLMFCYDPVFLGHDNPVTFLVGFGCLVGSIFMFRKELRLGAWGPNIRMAVATVLVFWTFVEVVARNGLLTEIWVDPMNHLLEMSSIAMTFVILSAWLIVRAIKGNHEKTHPAKES